MMQNDIAQYRFFACKGIVNNEMAHSTNINSPIKIERILQEDEHKTTDILEAHHTRPLPPFPGVLNLIA